MVGVPSLPLCCAKRGNQSRRTGWPISSSCSFRITHGPMTMLSTIAVTAAATDRKVMYRMTLKPKNRSRSGYRM